MKYTKETLLKYVKQVDTISDLVRLINNRDIASPSSINQVSKKLKEFNIDTSHFVGSAKGTSNLKREQRKYQEILSFDDKKNSRTSRTTLLNAIKKEGSLEYKCSICGNTGIHNGMSLLLHIDHFDGNWKNNSISNLRFLCPNCHSQTDTFGFTGIVKY